MVKFRSKLLLFRSKLVLSVITRSLRKILMLDKVGLMDKAICCGSTLLRK
jgi:hypothetical protein